MDKIDLLLKIYKKTKGRDMRPSALNKLERFCWTLLGSEKKGELSPKNIAWIHKGYQELVNQL